MANKGHWIGMSYYPQYEDGMLEVVHEIALMKYLESSCDRSDYSPETMAAIDAASKAVGDLIRSADDDKLKDMIFDMETKTGDAESCQVRESFISGFIEGYRFLKQIQKSYNPKGLCTCKGGTPE